MATKTVIRTDAYVRHEIDTQRYAVSTSNKFIRDNMSTVEREYATVLNEFSDVTSRTQAENLAKAVSKRTSEVLDSEVAALGVELESFAKTESGWNKNLLSLIVGNTVNIAAPEVILKKAGQHVMNGGQTVNEFVGSVIESNRTLAKKAIMSGWQEGKTNAQIAKDIIGSKKFNFKDGNIEAIRRNTQAAIRTHINAIGDTARLQTFQANADIVKKEMILATLDHRTSQICQYYDRQVFDLGKGPRPPFHPNCRSLTVPLFKGETAESIVGKRPAVNAGKGYERGDNTTRTGRVRKPRKGDDRFKVTRTNASQTDYSKFMHRQPVAYQQDVLGVGKSKLFRENNLSIDDMVKTTRKGYYERPLTLAELEKKAAKEMFDADAGDFNDAGTLRMSSYDSEDGATEFMAMRVEKMLDDGLKPAVRNLDPDETLATQRWLDFEEGGGGDPVFPRLTDKPVVVKYKDQLHIIDGHHRAHLAKTSDNTFDAYVIDLDPIKVNPAKSKISASPTKTFYHGGVDVPTNDLKGLTFFTEDLKAAKSYQANVDGKFKVHEVNLNIKNPATWPDVRRAARKVGVTDDDLVVPFDDTAGFEFISRGMNDKYRLVVKELKDQGYDGAWFIDDFTLGGAELPGGSWVPFDASQITVATKVVQASTKTGTWTKQNLAKFVEFKKQSIANAKRLGGNSIDSIIINGREIKLIIQNNKITHQLGGKTIPASKFRAAMKNYTAAPISKPAPIPKPKPIKKAAPKLVTTAEPAGVWTKQNLQEFVKFKKDSVAIAKARGGNYTADTVINGRNIQLKIVNNKVTHKLNGADIPAGKYRAALTEGGGAKQTVKTAVKAAPAKPTRFNSFSFVDEANVGDSAIDLIDKLPKAQADLFKQFLDKSKVKSVFVHADATKAAISKNSKFAALKDELRVGVDAIVHRSKGTKGFTSYGWNHVVVKIDRSVDFSKIKYSELKKVVSSAIRLADDAGSRSYGMSYLPDTLSGSRFTTMVHELGHQMHYWVGKTQVPAKFKRGNKFKSLTEYGSTIPAEWHAEHFVSWLFDRAALAKWDPDVARYFDDMVAAALSNNRKGEKLFNWKG